MKEKEENHFISLLKNRNFIFLWISQAISIFCAQSLNFIIAYKIFEHRQSSFFIGLIFVFFLLPVFFLAPIAGVVVDHFSRRKIMIWTNFLQAAVVLVYLLVGKNWWLVYPIIFLYSIIDEFYYPAESAMLPKLVKKKNLAVGNFLFNLAGYVGLGFGFSLSGQVTKLWGANVVFILISLLLLIAMVASFLIQKDVAEEGVHHYEKNPLKEIQKAIKSNYKFLKKRKIIYFPMLVLLFFQMIVGGLAVAIPILGTEILKINFLDIGVKIILPIMVGAILGAVLVDRKIQGNRKSLVVGGIWGCGILVLIIGMMGYLNYVAYWLIFLVTFLLGIFVVMLFITSHTTIQQETPENMMGRVSATYKFLQAFGILIPVVFTGMMIDFFGVLPVIFCLSMVIFMIGVPGIFYQKKDFRVDLLKETVKETEK